MIYKPKNPVGYRALLTWKQAAEIYHKAKDFTRLHLDAYRDKRLIPHINDSARSVQRNIEEGYKRSTTKEYIEFLGFSRASLEELKGDFEELKREWREGIRWEDKGIEGKIREQGIRGTIIREIEGLLDLVYGQDCMMGRQIAALEKKMISDKTMPRSAVIKEGWRKSGSSEKKFWDTVGERYGIRRDDKGIIVRDDRGMIRRGETPSQPL